jgi:hypothetical protein
VRLSGQGLSALGDPAGKTREFSVQQLKALRRVEMVTELKCIEG